MQSERKEKTAGSEMLGVLKGALPQFVGFELFFRLLGFAIFTPFLAWLGARLIAWSGSSAISNYDLIGFFLSLKGFLYLFVVVSITYALLFFEVGGLVALAIANLRGKVVRLPQLVGFLSTALPALWLISIRQFFIYLAVAVPCLALAGAAYQVLLTKHDLYYYLTAKPPAFWLAAGILGVAAIAFAVSAVRLFVNWLFSVPLVLFTNAAPREAMRKSRKLVLENYWTVIGLLLQWLAWVAVISMSAAGAIFLLKHVLLGMAGQRVALVLSMTALLGVLNVLVAGFASILTVSLLAVTVARHFLNLQPDVHLPEKLSGKEFVFVRRFIRVLRTSWVLVIFLALITTFVGWRLADQIEFRDSVGIIAHRGSSLTAPENTLAAIQQAIDEGADVVEIDVQETRDGTVVVAHDKDLKRVWNIDKGIWEVTYEELKELDSGSWFSPEFKNQRIQTLAQVIEAVRGRARLSIEMKFSGHEQALAQKVVKIIQEHNFSDQCIVASLDYDRLRLVTEEAPGLRTGVIVNTAIGDITGLNCDLLSISAKAANRDLIDRAKQKGLEVHVWTVNDVPQMNAMIGMGVDYIITDDPKLLAQVIGKRRAMAPAQKALLQLGQILENWL